MVEQSAKGLGELLITDSILEFVSEKSRVIIIQQSGVYSVYQTELSTTPNHLGYKDVIKYIDGLIQKGYTGIRFKKQIW